MSIEKHEGYVNNIRYSVYVTTYKVENYKHFKYELFRYNEDGFKDICYKFYSSNKLEFIDVVREWRNLLDEIERKYIK